MGKYYYYLWFFIIALYVFNPRHFPIFRIDNLIAIIIFLVLYYKYKKQAAAEKKPDGDFRQRNQYQSDGQSQGGQYRGVDTLKEAFAALGVSDDTTFEEVRKAYLDKVLKNHPDKVSHLSEELQDKAKELTQRLNDAFDILKRHYNQ
jgi:hypothetical protein